MGVYKIIPAIFFLVFSQTVFSQLLKGNISIKSKDLAGKESLLIGDFWFDVKSQVVVYDLSFPDDIQMFFFTNEFVLVKEDSVILRNQEFKIEPSYWGFFLFDFNIEEELKMKGFELADIQTINASEYIKVYQFDADYILLKSENNALKSIVSLHRQTMVQQIIFDNLTYIEGFKIPAEIFNTQFQKSGSQKQWIAIKNLESGNSYQEFESLLNKVY